MLDENLSSRKISEPLRVYQDWEIKRHDEVFKQGQPDHEWLPVCGANGWIVITCDKRIRSAPKNVEAVRVSAAQVFMFGNGSYRAEEYAAALVTFRQKILRLARNTKGPFFGRISQSGVVLISDFEDDSARRKTDRKYVSGAALPKHLQAKN